VRFMILMATLGATVLLNLGWPLPMAATGGLIMASVALQLFLRSVRGAG
jgi:hypothetical protein